jgi:hypothetical protein
MMNGLIYRGVVDGERLDTLVGWAESKKTMSFYEKLRYLWPVVGKSEALGNQHFPNLNYRRLLETKEIGSTMFRSMTMASVN